MCFSQLYESAQRNELTIVEGGLCHWHLRRDGQLTIREIISTQPGAGSRMLTILRQTPGAANIVAKCPAHLESNQWYVRRGFLLERTETTRTGRALNVWRLDLPLSSSTAPGIAGASPRLPLTTVLPTESVVT